MDPAAQRDLIERLTSRKFLIGILVIGLALLGWATGNLSYSDMVQTALWVAGLFMGAEGLGDAAGRLASRPAATTTTVNNPTDAVSINPPPPPPMNLSDPPDVMR